MKYTYAYKTSDGQRHEASIEAKSREEVFVVLRGKGIKPIKVVASDGSKANGEIVVRGVRKRVVVAAAVTIAVLAGTIAFTLGRGGSMSGSQSERSAPASPARPLARQTIDGNRNRLENLPKDLFRFKAEWFLARFAEPGQFKGRSVSVPEAEWPTKADFMAAIAAPILTSDDEYSELIDLKRIVTGMKREMADYLKAGGLVSGYIRELVKRQQTEISYREQAESQLTKLVQQLYVRTASGEREASPQSAASARDKAGQTAYDYWLKANAQLQSLGIMPMRLPDALRKYQAQVIE